MDKKIYSLIKRRNEKGMELLIDEYAPLIKAIVKKHLYNLPQYQEECINDVYLGIWNNIESFEIEMKDLPLNDKEDVKLVFSSLAELYDADSSDLTYNFVYDYTTYKNNTKEINVNKNITIGDNELSLDTVTVKPDRVLISGYSKGFSAWHENKDVNYYYDIVDASGDAVPLKEEIGKGAYFYRNYRTELQVNQFNIDTLKIIPYTYDEINTNTKCVLEDGRTKYILEDKIITVNLK